MDPARIMELTKLKQQLGCTGGDGHPLNIKEKLAERMTENTRNKLPAAKLNDKVLLYVSELDRGPLDPCHSTIFLLHPHVMCPALPLAEDGDCYGTIVIPRLSRLIGSKIPRDKRKSAK